MDFNTIKTYIDSAIEQAMKFSTKKYGDTPTDVLQLTPKKYVDAHSAAAGSNTQIQFNNSGALGASSGLTFDKTNIIVTLDAGATNQAEVRTPNVTGSTNNCALYFGEGSTVDGNAEGTAVVAGRSSGSGTAGDLTLSAGNASGTGNAGSLYLTAGISNNASASQGHIIHNSGYDGSYSSSTPAGGATDTLDLSVANEHRIQMPGGNVTLAISNANNGQKFLVSITQDSGGSRTVTWFTTIRWAGGVAPTLTTTASKRDTFGFVVTGVGTYDGFIVGQNI